MNTEHVSLAGEYAVASQICRMGHFAHITYGNLKEMDILVYGEKCFIKVEVKSKIGDKWPCIKGIPDEDNHILVFVDFQSKKDNERPDFYVLTGSDWRGLVPNLRDIRDNKNYKGFDSKDGHIPTWTDGKKGIGIRNAEIEEYRERWDKLNVVLRNLEGPERI